MSQPDGAAVTHWSRSDGTHGTSTDDGNGNQSQTTYAVDGSSSTQWVSPDGSHGSTVDDGQGDVSSIRYTADGSSSETWSKSDGSSGTTFINALTGEGGGSSISADGSDHETWDTLYLANGAVEAKTSSLDGSGNGLVDDSVQQADGSWINTKTYTNGNIDVATYDAATEITSHVLTNSDGSSGTTFINALTGEGGGSSVSADGSDHETWDTLYLANGAVETKTSSLDGSGNGSMVDVVTQADGSSVKTTTYTSGISRMDAVGVSAGGGDTFTWGTGLQDSTLQTVSGNDKLSIGEGVTPDQLWFSQNGSDLDISILGTHDQIAVNGWFNGTANQLQSINVFDGETIVGSDVQRLVDAMATFAVPDAGQATYTPQERSALTPVLAATWH